jgi:hypothetical protein
MRVLEQEQEPLSIPNRLPFNAVRLNTFLISEFRDSEKSCEIPTKHLRQRSSSLGKLTH